MNAKSLRVLEYDKIIELLKSEITSNLGKTLATRLKPSTNQFEISTMQKETSESSGLILQHGNIPFGAIHDISDHVKLTEIGGYLSPRQLLEVGDTLRAGKNVHNFIVKTEGNREKFPIMYALAAQISILKDIEERIAMSIIGDDQISDNASPELRRIRREMDNKNIAIKNKLESIIRSSEFQKYLQDSLVTIRQDRYVIPVKSEYKHAVKGLVHDQSSSGSTFYIEPFAIVQLNNELRELVIKEQQEIEHILKEISAMIGLVGEAIRTNLESLAQLDFISGKGRLSIRMKGCEPELDTKGVVRIVRGRHPLIDPKVVVPNTLWIGDGFKTLLVTGPNTGGKTVTLKTLGLLSLMHQAGLHIPADHGSRMTVFSGIYADIGDEQSIEQSLSTFSSHMTNIVEILNQMDKNSLVLFDELGAGTDPTEGAALAMAILTKLYKAGVTTVATTHYSELKEFAIVNEGIENACVEFDVATLSPTYRLLIGVPGKSNAFEISLKLGLSQDVIDSAKHFVNTDSIQFETVMANIEENRKKAESDMDEAMRIRAEMEKLKTKLKDKEDKFIEQRDKILREAREEARQVLKDAREESERVVKEMRGLASASAKERNQQIEASKRSLRDALDKVSEPLYDDTLSFHEIPKDLRLGDEVRIVHLGQNALVASLPDAQGNLTVQAGIMKVNVNIKNLMLVKPKEAFTQEVKVTRSFAAKATGMKAEIDLRGNNVEEASMVLDKYIDDAILANLKTVRIIHGKGTGALRNGLLDYFKQHRHIKSFKMAEYNEGGSGVTVLELK